MLTSREAAPRFLLKSIQEKLEKIKTLTWDFVLRGRNSKQNTKYLYEFFGKSGRSGPCFWLFGKYLETALDFSNAWNYNCLLERPRALQNILRDILYYYSPCDRYEDKPGKFKERKKGVL